jgi:hypothetical protein
MPEQPRLTTDEARGGTTPRVSRYVLSISLAAIVILFAILLILYR